MKILNPWKLGTKGNPTFYEENDIVFKYGDYSIYHQFGNNYLYVYKDRAFNCLAGLNKKHLMAVAERNPPKGKYGPDHFLYDRALESLEMGEELAKL